MNLYIISQSVKEGYDTYDSMVVAAETEEDARGILPSNTAIELFKWAEKEHVSARLIGEAIDGTESGVILASYNAY